MSIKVVMTARVLSRKEIEAYRNELGVEFETAPCKTEDELIATTRDADAIITLMQPFSRRVIEHLESCRLIFNAGTGFDTIDVQAATEHGICISYPGDYCMEEVSDHAMALLLASARKITRLDRAVRENKWNSFEKREFRNVILPSTYPVRGSTLGLIGFGRIGRLVASKAMGYGLEVIAYDPGVPEHVFTEMGVESSTLTDMLPRCDFISIQASFSPSSKQLLGMGEFRIMKNTAYLINVARGAFLDQDALCQALAEKEIAGAALDVVAEEPNGIGADHPLLQFDNVIVTAHSAYYSEESSRKYKQRIYDAVASIANNTWPEWCINPEFKTHRP